MFQSQTIPPPGGYKGYGLALMVELFCGIVPGATWGPNIRSWQAANETREADLGQFFMALDPAVFEDGFSGRLQQLIDVHRTLNPVIVEIFFVLCMTTSFLNLMILYFFVIPAQSAVKQDIEIFM